MATKHSSKDRIAAARRKSVAQRRVGIGAKCQCGEDRPQALIGGSGPILCAECKRRAQGRTIYDKHHVAGKSNHGLTIPIPANDHRAVLSEAQYEWPKETLKNPDRSPLLAAAACIRGFIDTIKYLLDKLLLWVAHFLEALNEFLVAQLGPRWWTRPEFTALLEGKL